MRILFQRGDLHLILRVSRVDTVIAARTTTTNAHFLQMPRDGFFPLVHDFFQPGHLLGPLVRLVLQPVDLQVLHPLHRARRGFRRLSTTADEGFIAERRDRELVGRGRIGLLV